MAMIHGPVFGRKGLCFATFRHMAHIFEYNTLSCIGLTLTINEGYDIDYCLLKLGFELRISRPPTCILTPHIRSTALTL